MVSTPMVEGAAWRTVSSPYSRAQIDIGKDGRTQNGFTEVRLAEVRPEEIRPAEVRPAEVRSAEVRPGEARPAEVRPAEVRHCEARPAEARPAEVRPVEVRLAEVRPVEVRLAEVRPAEARHAEACPAEVRPAEVRPAEVRPAEVRPAEVRPNYVRMPLSPLIPFSSSLFQDCQILFIRHRSPAAPCELPRHISREREGMQQLSAISRQLWAISTVILSGGAPPLRAGVEGPLWSALEGCPDRLVVPSPT